MTGVRWHLPGEGLPRLGGPVASPHKSSRGMGSRFTVGKCGTARCPEIIRRRTWRGQSSWCPVVASTYSGRSPSCRSPVDDVPEGSNMRTEQPGELGLCSSPRGTTKVSHGPRLIAVSTPAASRIEMFSVPSTTRKNSSVSSWTCPDDGPRYLDQTGLTSVRTHATMRSNAGDLR